MTITFIRLRRPRRCFLFGSPALGVVFGCDRYLLRAAVEHAQSFMPDAKLAPALDHWPWCPGILDLDARVIVHASG
jgi:hypothetical protein